MKPVYILSYDEKIKGGLTAVVSSLVDACPGFELVPIHGVYGNPARSAAYTGKAFFKIFSRVLARRPRLAIVIIGSRGDALRTLPFLVLLKLLGVQSVLYFHKDLKAILAFPKPASEFLKAFWARCARLVFLSPSLAREAWEQEGLPRDRICIIRNGLGCESLGRERKRHLGRDTDVIFVGRWSREKGRDDLTMLFSDEFLGPVLKCEVFGGGGHVPRDTNIEFHGWADSSTLVQAMAKAKVMILPSYAEAYPMVLLEAAALGTPFVTTRIAGIPDIVNESNGGILVEPGDVASMAAALNRLVGDPEYWERLSGSAYDWAQLQTADKMASEWRALIDELSPQVTVPSKVEH